LITQESPVFSGFFVSCEWVPKPKEPGVTGAAPVLPVTLPKLVRLTIQLVQAWDIDLTPEMHQRTNPFLRRHFTLLPEAR